MEMVKQGEFYYLGTNQQVKNERIFYAKGGDSILQKLLVVVIQEQRETMVQFKTIFVIRLGGRPTSNYTAH
jgi:hypothetical protein